MIGVGYFASSKCIDPSAFGPSAWHPRPREHAFPKHNRLEGFLGTFELAEDLGRGSLNAVQIFKVLFEEAERSHQVTWLVRGTLVRELWERLSDGGRPSWTIQTASRSPGHSVRGLHSPRRPIWSRWIELATPYSPIRRRPAGARLPLTTSCCARFCPTRKPELPVASSGSRRPATHGPVTSKATSAAGGPSGCACVVQCPKHGFERYDLGLVRGCQPALRVQFAQQGERALEAGDSVSAHRAAYRHK